MYLNSSFMTIIPAIIVVALGFFFRSRQTPENLPRRWTLFLFVITVLLFANQLIGLHWENYQPGALLQPTLLGVLVALFIHLAENRSLWSSKVFWLTLSLCLITLGLASYWSLRTDPILLIGAVIAVLTWRAWDWRGWKRWLARLVLFILTVAAIVYILDPYPLLLNQSRSLQAWLYIGILFVFPVAGVFVMGRLVQSSLASASPVPWLLTLFRLWLAALLLILIGFLTTMETVWVQAEDSLTILPLFISMSAIAAAMLIAWEARGWHKLWALAFALFLMLAASFADQQGWKLSPTLVTESRAGQITHAIQRYADRRGAYPASLSDLSPAYLLLIQQPMIYRDQTWCYEGGSDFFRLGYVYQPAFGVPDQNITIRIAAAKGTPPESGWACEQALARARSRFP